jgi:hypothetical protein
MGRVPGREPGLDDHDGHTHPDDAAQAGHGIRALAGGHIERYRDEERFRHADGRTLSCAVSAVPIGDDAGRVDHLLVHYLDVSDLKEAEVELQHLAVDDPLTDLLNRRGFNQRSNAMSTTSTAMGRTGRCW